MVGEMAKLLQQDFVERAQRIFSLAKDFGDRALPGKPFVFFVQSELRPDQGNEVFRITSIENGKTRLESDRATEAPEQCIGNRVKGAPTHTLAASSDQRARAL